MKKILKLIFIQFILISCLFGVSLTIFISNLYSRTYKKPVVVLLGDSLTYLSNTPNSYSDILIKKWSDKANVINQGIPGDGIRNLYNNSYQIERRISVFNPDYSIILMGINDIAYLHQNSSRFYNYYNWVINEIINQNPYIKIFISKFPWCDSDLFPDRPLSAQLEFNRIIELIANKTKLPLANLWNLFYNKRFLLSDGIHQSIYGAQLIVDEFTKKFYDLIVPNYLKDNDLNYIFFFTTIMCIEVIFLIVIVYLKKHNKISEYID